MKNPLTHRYLRELKQEFGKYLVILILLVATISFVSGFLVAAGSMKIAYDEGFTKYNIEDGHFRTEKQISVVQKRRLEEQGIAVSEQYYRTLELNNDSRLRVYANREEINTVCLMSGSLPQASDEIALDRMYAENNEISVGDRIESNKGSYLVTGYVALPDYSCLFENNSDSMFDAIKFGVGMMTEEGFSSLTEALTYTYVWKYNDPPKDESEEKQMADDLSEKMAGIVELEDFVPLYANQAIQFTGDDMGSDSAMMEVLLYIVMVILAFVFGLTTADTISRESAEIGTLRALGFTKGELIRHYMVMPIVITLIGALMGNILGYTYLKDLCASLYYGSYSLPTYVTIWNAEAFVKTTVVPIILMALITFFVLARKLNLTPLEFLRKTDRRKAGKRVIRLSHRLSLPARFRIRIISQNIGNYLIMFIGIVFANVLLMFGLIMQPILSEYQNSIEDNMISEYQYFMAIPTISFEGTDILGNLLELMEYQEGIETENPDAEKFSAWSLEALDGPYEEETITLYGLESESRYLPLTLNDEDIYVSSAYAEKFKLQIGDEIRLKEKYESTEYRFTVSGIYDYSAGMSIFMTREHLNRTFDLDEDYFGGYFSDTPITDIKNRYIENVIDLDALTKLSRQLDRSMGEMMSMIDAFAVLIFLVLIYLLSKVIIEKNASSISMTKILGYSDKEIRRLYIHSTTIVVILCLLLSLPLVSIVLAAIWEAMMSSMMSGWLPFVLPPSVILKMILIGVLSYSVIAIFEFRKIRKVPMTLALKNVE